VEFVDAMDSMYLTLGALKLARLDAFGPSLTKLDTNPNEPH
jgi:hypothetical protein